MTLKKFLQRHILVDETGQVVLSPTVEGAKAFLRTELKVSNLHVFNY